jgi:hypothetical protein
VATSPPLTIQREHMGQIAEGIGAGLERLSSVLAAA